MKDDDGCLILPLSTNEFFVAYNLGKIDMKKEISKSVATGRFVRSMNKYVVEHRIDYVYGIDNSMMAFVAQYWGTSEAPYFPLTDYAAGRAMTAASLRRQPAVDHEFRAGREGEFVAREEQDRGGNLLRLAHAPHGRGARQALAHPLGVLRPRDALEHHRRLGKRGMHGIHPDLVPGARAMERGGFGQ